MHTVRSGFLRALFFISIFLPRVLSAQDSVLQEKPPGYLASYWHNAVGLVASPVKWKGEEWSKAGASLVVTGMVISMDEPLSQPFFKWQTATGTTFGDVGYVIGSVPFQLGFSAAALGAGALSKHQPLTNFALDNLQAQVYTGGITWLAKEIFHRERPIKGNGPYEWHGPFKSTENKSFFSGHTSLAFSTANMIFLHSGKKWWVGLLSYGMATGVAISRMQRQAHWTSDVIMGAVIGSAISTFVFKQQQKRRSQQARVQILP